MTKLKRLVAVAMALLMIFGSMSVMAYAFDPNTDDGFDLGITTKILRQVNGEWIETEKVRTGETVKARVYLDTDFYTNNGRILFFYNNDFFSDSYPAEYNSLVLNKYYQEAPYAITGTFTTEAMTANTETILVKSGKITSEFAEANNYIDISYMFDGASKNQLMNGDKWFCEFELTVNDDAAGTGDFFVVPETMTSPSFQYGRIDLSKGPENGDGIERTQMNAWQANLNAESHPVTLFVDTVKATFKSTQGHFADGKSILVIENEAGSAVTVEEPVCATADFKGWRVEGTTDAPVPVTALPTSDTTYEAVWESTSPTGETLGFRTEIYRLDAESGEWILTEKVRPGEEVKARVFIDTTYNTNSGEIVLLYDNDFFESAYTTIPQAITGFNSDPASEAALYQASGDIRVLSDATVNKKFINNGYLTDSQIENETFIHVSYSFDPDTGKKLSGDDWFFEIDLKVKDDATGWGDCYTLEETFASPDRIKGTGNIPYSTGEGVHSKESIGMWLWKPTFDISSNPVTTYSSITFNANTGAFDAADPDTFVIEGNIGDTVDETLIPAISKAGSTFVGWYDASIADPTVDDIIAVPAELDYDEIVLNAYWIAETEITFVYNNGDADETVIVTPGFAFEDVDDPSKEGHYFVGWTTDPTCATVTGLPAVYPDTETTYYAVYEANTYTVKYYVLNPETNAFELVSGANTVYGEAIPATPSTYTVPEGYVLSGAYKDVTFTTALENGAVMPNHDVELYYRLSVGTFDAKFYLDEEKQDLYATVPTVYGELINAPADPESPVAGYKFSGWVPEVGIMDAEGKVYIAAWDVADYKAEYYVDGELYETYDIAFGSSMDIPADPYLEGYEFIGWTPTVPDTMPAEDQTFYAQFEALKYTSNFYLEADDVDDDTVDPYDTAETTYGEAIDLPTEPTKQGYVFAGWSPEVPATMPAEELTFVAVWAPAEDTPYKVEVYVMDTEGDYSLQNTFNKTGKTGSMAVYDAVILEGFELDDALSTITAEILPDGSTVLEVYIARNEYTITFDPDNGEEVNSKTYLHDAIVTVPAEPTKEGYTFMGWAPEVVKAAVADADYTAQWQINQYTITFENTGDTVIDPIKQDYATDITAPADPKKEGYTFTGWDTEIPATMPAEDLTITATWEVKSFDANFYAEEGDTDVYETVATNYGEAIVLPAEPTKEGYTFAGWLGLPETMPAEDVDIVAQWTANEYTVTFISDGSTYKEIEVAYDSAIAMPEDPAKTGYTFAGWAATEGGEKLDELGIMDSVDGKTFYALYTANIYDATFMVDGEEYDVISAEFGSAIGLPAEPTKEGYTFAGWSPDVDIMDEEGKTFEATWTIDSYTLTWVVDDASTPVEYNYGSTVVPMANPSKEGHTFAGWDTEIPATMPANDLTITATWNVNSYTITWIIDGEVTIDEAEYGSDINVTAPSKDGYDFAGWTDLAGNAVTVPAKMPANDLVFKATWNAIEVPFAVVIHYTDVNGTEVDDTYDGTGTTGYTVKVVDDDLEEEGTVCVILGLDISYPANYMVDASKLNEFEEVIAGDGSTVLNIYLVPVKYTATFKVDDEVYATKTADYGTLVNTIVPAEPTKEGYTFTGWSPVINDTTRLQTNRAFDAQWSVNEYTITFDADGGKFADNKGTNEVKADYGEGFIVPATPTKEGYTFLRWDVAVPATMPAKNMTITAIWVANNYTITFDTDGGSVVYPIVQNYGTAVTAPAAPTKTGYDFAGWDIEVPATMPAENITITATWTAKEYPATFISEGEEFEVINVAFDSAVTAPATAPEKTGYNFAGWAATEGGSVLAELGTMNSESGKTYYAVFTPKTYDATFMVNGEEYDVISAEFGSAIDLPAEPTKEGYDFNGWSPAVDIMDEEGKTFEATWAVKTYNVTWNVDGNKDVVPYEFGATITVPAAPVKEGYDFAGWTPAVAATMPASDVEYVATWNAQIFTVEYKVDGETYYGPVDVAYGETIPAPAAAPSKVGYTFRGWVDTDNNALTSYGTMPAKNLVFEPDWAANNSVGYEIEIYVMGTDGVYPSQPTDKIIFNDGVVGEDRTATYTPKEGFTVDATKSVISGTIPATGKLVLKVYLARAQWKLTTVVDGTPTETSYYYEAVVATPETPVKEGYTFAGWDNEIPATMPNNDVTVNATWTVNEYTITFADTGDTVIDPIIADYGDAITAPAAPNKEGYTFVEWSEEIPATMPATDKTITAIWAANTYTITFDTDGGSTVAPIEQECGTAVTAPADPTKTGYTFIGWDAAVPATMPAGDMTITAKWMPNTYDAVFTVDGTEYAVVPAVFGTQINAPVDPVKEGYTFKGWNLEVGTMDEEGKTFEATWQINKYTVKFVDGNNVVAENSVEYGEEILPAQVTKEGHEFIGWAYEGTTDIVDFENNAPTVPANDVTFTAIWSVNKYKLIYRSYAGSSVYEQYDVEYGTPAADMPVPAENPTRTGQTFLGWTALPETMPDSPYYVTGKWSVNEYTITFEDTGDMVIDPIVEKYDEYIGDFIPTEEPTKTGYEFVGWDKVVPDYMPAEDMTVTAIWEAIEYTITFAETGDSVIAPITGIYDSQVVAPADPTKEGHEFKGWDTEIPATMPANDMTITAQWQISQFTITFADTGDTVIDPITDDYGASVTAPAAPNKEGYTFVEWSEEIPATMPAGDKTITAVWSINSYTVEYVVDGETYYGPETVTYGSVIPGPDIAPKKLGSTFISWNDAYDKTPTAYGSMPAKDLVFNAVWESSVNVGYELEVYEMDTNGNYPAQPTTKVTFTDGVVGETRTADYAVPEGFTLNTDDSVLSGVIPAEGKLVLKAYVERNEWKLITVVDGVSNVEATYRYDAVVATPADPVKEGYTFTGWEPAVPTVMPNSDYEIVAQFVQNSYTVTFSAGEGEFANGDTEYTAELPYGGVIEAPAADPERTGYAFIGWATEADPDTVVTVFGTMGAEDVKYVAVWSQEKYVVTFYNYDDSEFGPAVTTTMYVMETTEYNYGDTIVFPTEPSFDNYVFTGWIDGEGNAVEDGMTMPAEDVNIYATFERVVVKLIPKSENATTMIERNGVIESYNTGYTVTTDGYEKPDNFDTYFVYGLEEVLTGNMLLNDYIAVQGDGEIKLIYADAEFAPYYGTGAKIQVYDRVTGDLVEEFFVIIFGDLNGDSLITPTDITIVADEVGMLTLWSEFGCEEYREYMVRAAEITNMKDKHITVADHQLIADHVGNVGIINQVTAKIEY